MTALLGDDGAKSEAGYKKPPLRGRFQKGQSGNPKGRPKGRHKDLPYEAVLGQKLTVKDGDRRVQMPADQAFILQLSQKGLAGDSSAGRAVAEALESARARKHGSAPHERIQVILRQVCCPLINTNLQDHNMAKVLDAFGPNARLRLEPWIVHAALKRLGRELTPEEKAKVEKMVRIPSKINWKIGVKG